MTVLHREFATAPAGLSEAQLYYQPADGVNHIAFVAWHCARNEDMVIQTWLLERPTVWLARGLDERWNLPAEARALRLPSLDLLGQTLLLYPVQHLGEISVLRQLQGLPGIGA